MFYYFLLEIFDVFYLHTYGALLNPTQVQKKTW